jgi:hypothetical protein
MSKQTYFVPYTKRNTSDQVLHDGHLQTVMLADNVEKENIKK